MGYLTWWSFPRKAWIIILSELAIIGFLSSWVYVQYLSDIYFQAYINSLAPVLVPVMSVTFGVCSASIAAYLYIGMRKIRTMEATEPPIKKRVQPRKIHREAEPASQPPKPAPITTADKPKLRPLTASRHHSHGETTRPKEQNPASET